MTKKEKYYLDASNRFVVENYNWAKPFSNFFPGIAGRFGIPLWIYYVSRGQAICSLGVRDKDHQILEFLSFNRACQAVSEEGFRTFLRFENKEEYFEPFLQTNSQNIIQKLFISPGEIEIYEENSSQGIASSVVYFPLVNLPFAGLVRSLTIKNIATGEITLSCLDGLPRILPYGVKQDHIKFTARHIEAMMGVSFFQNIPVFRLKQTAADQERVDKLSGGNFYFSLEKNGAVKQMLVDPELIFADPFQHKVPWNFSSKSFSEIFETPQRLENMTPCAFSGFTQTLAPGESKTLVSILGNVPEEKLLEDFLPNLKQESFLDEKRKENQKILAKIGDMAFTASSQSNFDQYCAQDFLDNVMRGGMPAVFQSETKKTVFYIYSRQNGDLERDYHYFVLEPTYLSQGTGHYRSIYQNRRTDTWFFPEIEDTNIRWFMNLLQTDGYNPLEVNGLSYKVVDKEKAKKLIQNDTSLQVSKLLPLLETPFTPGEFLQKCQQHGSKHVEEYQTLLGNILALCDECEIGSLHEGFWVDHWLYNLDTIDVYLMVYPDRLYELLLENKEYTFFDNPDIILPRHEKSIQREDGKIRRYGAVVRDAEKLEMIESRSSNRFTVRTTYGTGEIYQTCLLVKLLSVITNRIATLDPGNVGIEMEADKPGWNDSMNGLPGLFGSSLCETLELQKACSFLSKNLETLEASDVAIFEELLSFMDSVKTSIEKRQNSTDENRFFLYWDESNTAKETYRQKTKLGVSGREKIISTKNIKEFVDTCLLLLNPLFQNESNASQVMNSNGVPYTYFLHKVTEHQTTSQTSHQGYTLVTPSAFEKKNIRLFLEGPVHYMKVHPEQAKSVYEAVRNSPLFDQKLKMYKSCEDMSQENFELGRAVGAYPRGWLENESIYLHMEYKYLLEILRSGLYEEFYNDIKTALIPFCDPEVYGRSILEGASFIVSSAYHDPSFHGRGFQPRLSGITCEMLHMWILMVAGPTPFSLGEDNTLRLTLQPALAGWFFTKEEKRCVYYDEKGGKTEVTFSKNTFAFKFMGSTLVVYHNETKKNTYGEDGVSPQKYIVSFQNGKQKTIWNRFLEKPLAEAVRNGQVARIDVTLS